jgi:Snf7
MLLSNVGIQREQEKVKRSLKDAAKKGDKDVCRVLAKEIVASRKAINKIHCAKAQIKSIEYGMTQQLGNDLFEILLLICCAYHHALHCLIYY